MQRLRAGTKCPDICLGLETDASYLADSSEFLSFEARQLRRTLIQFYTTTFALLLGAGGVCLAYGLGLLPIPPA